MTQGSTPSGVVARNWGLTLFELAVAVPTIGLLVAGLVRNDASVLEGEWVALLVWAVIIGAIEMMPVPMWRGTTISMGFPLLMLVAFIYQPVPAAATAFLAATDPREFKHEIGVLRALFNRSQVALAVGASSATFHALASFDSSTTVRLLLAASLAAVVDYLVNSTLVALAASLHYRMNPFKVIRQLRVGRLSEFVVSYLGLAVFGLILAKVFRLGNNAFWAVPAFIIPLLLARQMFFRSKALEEAHKELQDREHVLRSLSNRMAEERQDERLQIAAFLHDDLAQLLFRLSIQVDVARRYLGAGNVDDTERTLAAIKETKNRTSDRIRALIRDLHRSPLGRAGLGEALHSFIAEAGRDAEVQFHVDFEDVELPPPIALLLYHIAREGVMNALKHAEASNMWLSVRQDGGEVEFVLRDDGVGFDGDAPEPEGHFGLTMMRERATVGGGTFEVSSAPGEGATITVRFPTSWLQEEEVPAGGEAHEPQSAPRDGVSRAPGQAPRNPTTGSAPA